MEQIESHPVIASHRDAPDVLRLAAPDLTESAIGELPAVVRRRRRPPANTTNRGREALLDAIADGRPRWQGRAACRGMETRLFYPTEGESAIAAREVCQGCEVRAQCLSHAIGDRERFGVWGDTSERQRRRLRRQ